MGVLEDVVVAALTADRVPHVFQPIWRSDTHQLLGFEALARFTDGDPESVFRTAREMGRGPDLDRLSIRTALIGAQSLPGFLFVNIDPNHLGQSQGPFGSVGLSVATYRARRSVVLELTEQAIGQRNAVQAGVQRMQRRSIALALDDAGTGRSNAARLAWLQPRFVKIAASVIAEWHDGHPQKLQSWVRLADSIGAETIAEGIEDARWIEPLSQAGVHYIQGFAWGRPEPAEVWLERLLAAPTDQVSPALHTFAPSSWPTAEPPPTLLSVIEIGEIMYSQWPYPAIVVDSENRLVGMNLRAERHLGTSLEHVALKPVEEVLGLRALEPGMVHVSAMLPSELAPGDSLTQKILLHHSDGEDEATDLTIVGLRIGSRRGHYKLFMLWPEVDDANRAFQLGVDPLSGLPTRPWWEVEADRRWKHAAGTVLFIDLDGLKQVNDLFGHREGDRLIREAGRIFGEYSKKQRSVAVRYGGDEFLIVTKGGRLDQTHRLARDLLARYAESAAALGVPAGFSYGIAEFSAQGLDQAIAEADRRLYEQKGLILASQSGSRLVLTAQGRRALWRPIDADPEADLSIDDLAAADTAPDLRQQFAQFIDPPHGISVIEINAGRGQMAYKGGLVSRLGPGSQYLAVDQNGRFLRLLYAQKAAVPAGLRVHFLRSSAEHLPVISRSADLAVLAFSLPPNPGPVLTELARIVRPGGMVGVAFVQTVEGINDLWEFWPYQQLATWHGRPATIDAIQARLPLKTMATQTVRHRLHFASARQMAQQLAAVTELAARQEADAGKLPSRMEAHVGPIDLLLTVIFYLYRVPEA